MYAPFWFWVAKLLPAALWILPLWLILRKVGRSPAISLIVAVPTVGFLIVEAIQALSLPGTSSEDSGLVIPTNAEFAADRISSIGTTLLAWAILLWLAYFRWPSQSPSCQTASLNVDRNSLRDKNRVMHFVIPVVLVLLVVTALAFASWNDLQQWLR
jgi:hypothetical protein